MALIYCVTRIDNSRADFLRGKKLKKSFVAFLIPSNKNPISTDLFSLFALLKNSKPNLLFLKKICPM